MKTASRKLQLNRETLLPLQSDELDQINGGVTPASTAVVVSSNACWQASKAASQAVSQAVSRVSQQVTQTVGPISLPRLTR